MVTETRKGRVEGIKKDGYQVYLGIPYAKPPVGELRWRPPQETEPWEGVLEATSFQNRSMQPVHGGDDFYGKEFRDDPVYLTTPSEDSLYLNIWTPAVSGDEKLPVAFWIHGGAFLGGSGHEKEFDGEAYCRRGIILVTVNYRLGIWGFLAHPWLSAENEHHVSGNYGILDQIAALKWVYENIAAFGGDPENITLFGQSAGAMSVQTLVSSPLTGTIPKRAIMQSGGGYANGLNRDDLTLQVQERYGQVFSVIAGVSCLQEMRGLSTERVMELLDLFMEKVIPESHGLFLVPNIDGYVLESGYDTLIDQGRIKDIPYLLGSTRDDILVTPELKGQEEASPLYKGCISFSLKREQTGHMPAWVYFFQRNLPGDQAGAFHSSELWYTFGTWKRSWRPFTEQDAALSDEMLDCWASFMKNGTPGDPGWKPCTDGSSYVKRFG